MQLLCKTCGLPTCPQRGGNGPGCNCWLAAVSLEGYEADVMRTARTDLTSDELLDEAALGVASEAGEVAGLLRKALYQGHEFSRDKFIEESGDLLYYLTRGLKEVGSSLGECMKKNVEKRQAIYPNGFDPERSKARAK